MPSLAQQHRIAQAAVGARTVLALRAIWPALDRSNLDATAPDWLALALPIVAHQRAISAEVAAGYLIRHKVSALGAGATLDIQLAATIDPPAVVTSLMVTGPIALKRAAANGVDLAVALERANGTSSAAALRHALNGGRTTIADTTIADPDAAGWRRVASGNGCAFCQMLADRGGVYRDESAHFAAHDGCSCSAEPVWA